MNKCRVYREEVEAYLNQEHALINKYLNIIADGIRQNGGVIHFGNANLILKENTEGKVVPFECSNWSHYNLLTEQEKERAVELYSDDGWSSLYDIANWADIVTDYLYTQSEGIEKMKEKGYLPK